MSSTLNLLQINVNPLVEEVMLFLTAPVAGYISIDWPECHPLPWSLAKVSPGYPGETSR